MHHDIHTLYSELTRNITQESLKELSAKIIDSYRNKNMAVIYGFAARLGLNSDEMPVSRIFSQIIQKYHPDKYVSLKKEIDEHYSQKSYNELQSIYDIYISGGDEEAAAIATDFEEEYTYEESDFGYDEEEPEEDIYYSYEEEPDDEINAEETEEKEPYDETGFLEALTRDTFGNLEVMITPADLSILDGDLNLFDYNIIDLDGIDYCVNLTGLNLSGNNIYSISKLAGLLNLEFLYLSDNDIDSISCLADLENLKELDISFNEIDDISVLLDLENLFYVNLVGNPLNSMDVAEELISRGVIVIY